MNLRENFLGSMIFFVTTQTKIRQTQIKKCVSKLMQNTNTGEMFWPGEKIFTSNNRVLSHSASYTRSLHAKSRDWALYSTTLQTSSIWSSNSVAFPSARSMVSWFFIQICEWRKPNFGNQRQDRDLNRWSCVLSWSDPRSTFWFRSVFHQEHPYSIILPYSRLSSS